MRALHPHLEQLYARWTRQKYIAPDPLQFLSAYPDPEDRELVGLIASSLAFGNVQQIVRSIGSVLDALPRPAMWIDTATPRQVRASFAGFRHRYATGAELSAMLLGAKRIREEYGSVGGGFCACMSGDTDETAREDARPPRCRARTNNDADISGALGRFVTLINGGARKNYLVPEPALGSACKRLHLYLRWMVREDEVDPGGWDFVPRRMLLMPVDTHVHRIAKALGITARCAADLRMSREITAAFRIIAPDDPVRYDFALTRLGIRSDADSEYFLKMCGRCGVK